MAEYNGYNTYKEYWLSQRLQEQFADALEMQPDAKNWIWDFCIQYIQHFVIEADITADYSTLIWLKVLDALIREMEVITLMSRVTVIRKIRSRSPRLKSDGN